MQYERPYSLHQPRGCHERQGELAPSAGRQALPALSRGGYRILDGGGIGYLRDREGTMSKHTPGPWGFELENGEGGEWYSFNGPVLSWGWSDYAAGEQAKADARLIAAAPDLYKELDTALAFLEHPEAFSKTQLRKKWQDLKRRIEGEL